jgi:serine/threonine protein kinase
MVTCGITQTVRNVERVAKKEDIDVSRERDSQVNSGEAERDSKDFKTFIYPAEKLGVEIEYPNGLTIESLANLKHMVDGSHSNIFKCTFSGLPVVVKTIRQRSMSNKVALNEYKMECALLTRLAHSNVVKLLGIGKFVARNGKERPFMVLEKLEGCTLQYVLNRKTFRTMLGRPALSQLRCVEIALQLCRALQYMHEDFSADAVLIHRDLKPDNIGFDSTGVLKVIDFGLCTCVPRIYGSDSVYKMTGNTGSLRYMAPEVARNETYSEKVDIYSVGIIMWQTLTGRMPFENMGKEDHRQRVCMNDERPPLDKSLDVTLKDIMVQAWSPLHAQRPKASELALRLDAFIKVAHHHTNEN